MRHTSAKLHTKRPTAPVCCTNGSRAHTISCLGVGVCLKVNTRAPGRGALHKVDSIPLSLLTSEHHRASVVSLLGSPPRFPSYHIIEHASCIPYKPSTPVNRYIYRISQTLGQQYNIGERPIVYTDTTKQKAKTKQKQCGTTSNMCVCVFSSHSFWTSMDVPAGVTQEEGDTGFFIHLLSAVLALIFLARRIQPFLSLVDREVEFCVLTI